MSSDSHTMSAKYDIVAPEPAALIESLRSVGYALSAAVADIVYNSLAAAAKNIHITFHWSGKDSYVSILDDGCGLSEEELRNPMRPGSRNLLEERNRRIWGVSASGSKRRDCHSHRSA
jgi:hypothetical protein